MHPCPPSEGRRFPRSGSPLVHCSGRSTRASGLGTRYYSKMDPHASLILANRAFLDHETPRSGDSRPAAGNGGLLAALRPVIQPWDGSTGTTWIGAGRGQFDAAWTDQRGFELIETPRGRLRHRRLFIEDSTWDGHYSEVANSFLWPLLHLVREPLPDVTRYYPRPVRPSPEDWACYRAVNQAFASAALEESAARTCWVHDYQLALVPAMLREAGFGRPVGFFLHTPFPDPEVTAPYLLGEAREAFAAFVRGILGADLIGFQTDADLARFERAAAALAGATPGEGGVSIGGRTVRCGVYPVGIDVEDLLSAARTAATPSLVHASRAGSLPLVVGLERADFTKGIPERLDAIAEAFRRGHRFAYLGMASPTREGVPAYEHLDEAIESAAAPARAAAQAAGGRFSQVRATVGWPDVVALQREADVVFTSSLADGMNLVPLQSAIAQSLRPPAQRAVVITGRDAGAASAFAGFEADGLVSVDPLDQEEMVAVLVAALTGQPGRVSDRLVAAIQAGDALAWATRFLTSLEGAC